MANFNPSKISISLGHLFLLSNLVIGILGFSYLHWAEQQNQVKIWVFKHDLPAYTQIQPTDLTEKSFPARNIPAEAVKESDKIRDRYTVVAISKDRPITKNQLGRDLKSNHFLVGIPATFSMILGGNLKAGDIVDLTLVPSIAKDSPAAAPIVFSNTTILEIKSDPSINLPSQTSSALIVALPLDRQQDYVIHSPRATLSITKKL